MDMKSRGKLLHSDVQGGTAFNPEHSARVVLEHLPFVW